MVSSNKVHWQTVLVEIFGQRLILHMQQVDSLAVSDMIERDQRSQMMMAKSSENPASYVFARNEILVIFSVTEHCVHSESLRYRGEESKVVKIGEE